MDWILKKSYRNYLSTVIALPKGTPAPDYVPDKEVPWFVDKTHGIFNIIRSSYTGPELPEEFFYNFSGPGHEAEYDEYTDDASRPSDSPDTDTDDEDEAEALINDDANVNFSEDEIEGLINGLQSQALWMNILHA